MIGCDADLSQHSSRWVLTLTDLSPLFVGTLSFCYFVADTTYFAIPNPAFDRDGKYSEGYLEVLRPGPLPDLREIPDCPRKTVDARTMVEHRNCFTAAEDRIRVALRHGKGARS